MREIGAARLHRIYPVQAAVPNDFLYKTTSVLYRFFVNCLHKNGSPPIGGRKNVEPRLDAAASVAPESCLRRLSAPDWSHRSRLIGNHTRPAQIWTKLLFISQRFCKNPPTFAVGSRHLCTRPVASPPTRCWTSESVTRFRSPGMVCLSAEAATAKFSASCSPMPCARL